MQEGTRRIYTVDERAEAVRLAEEIGLTAAASKLSIPVPTVSHWLRVIRMSAARDGVSSQVKKKARKYTSSERADAVRLTSELGLTAAASRLDIPVTTLSGWSKQQRAQDGSGVPDTASSRRNESLLTSASTTVEEAAPSPPPAPKRPAKAYTPSERARALEFAAQEGITAAAIKFGISRFSIYEWQRKTRLHAQGKAADSPVVGSDDDKVAARDLRILSEWKTHPGLGPSQIRNQLRRQGFKVSVHTVRCVLEENGYVTPKVRRVSVHDQRYEAARPNQLWHLDFLHRYINKQKVYVLLVLDDYSRYIVGAGLWDGERVAAVEETFLSAVNRHGSPKTTMSDGGSAFFSWRGIGGFTRLLEELEIDQIIAETPQNNGKLEVLNANIQKEFFDKQPLFDLGEALRYLLHWVQGYNLRRTHHALGGLLVPADRYFGRADEVLASIESGRTPEGIGEPLSPGERQLDLFRVTSQRGRVEVYLLGHRILSREGQ
jgi:transposase InsO family protein/predicted kinase